MRYLLLIHENEEAFDKLPQEEQGRIMAEYRALSENLRRSGAYVAGEQLRPVADATTVRIRQGQTLTTDGPYAEMKEQLGGFYLITAENLDEALAWAAKVPSAR